MAKQKLYSTVEIELVLRLFSNFRKGQKLEVTKEEHQFLMQQFIPMQFYVYVGDERQVITYRNWGVYYNSSVFNTNGREAISTAIQPDYTLDSLITKAITYQSADILRELRYRGKPLGLLVQCAIIEMAFKLGLLPRRISESYPQPHIQTLVEELEANGTFNI